MKRLTKKIDNGRFVTTDAEARSYGETDPEDGFFYNYFTGEAVDKLAAYEDTGLEPEDITSMYKMVANLGIPIWKIKDLAKAEDEGRLVVLPCKIGDKVFYRCRNGEIKKGTISMLQQKADGSWKFRVSDRLGVSDWPAEDLGKLWFLTREEAEKAMEAE